MNPAGSGDRGTGVIPPRLRLARIVVRAWPLAVGRGALGRIVLAGFDAWPARADVEFDFGRLVDASLAPWPHGFRDLFLHGRMEPDETRAWLGLLRPGDVVIDGGANWGYFSLLASRAVGLAGRVLAFEPVPDTAASLQRNLDASGVRNVEIVQACLARSAGEATLHLFEGDPSAVNSTMGAHAPERWAREVRAPALSLDDVMDAHQLTPALLKLDVEGAELDALRGAERLLARAALAVVFEWNPITARGFGYDPRDVLDLLSRSGYSAWLAGPSGFIPFAVRNDVADWYPMVWCFKPGAMLDRAREARLFAS